MQLCCLEHWYHTLPRRHLASNWRCAPRSRNPTLLETFCNSLKQRGAVSWGHCPLFHRAKLVRLDWNLMYRLLNLNLLLYRWLTHYFGVKLATQLFLNLLLYRWLKGNIRRGISWFGLIRIFFIRGTISVDEFSNVSLTNFFILVVFVPHDKFPCDRQSKSVW